MTTPKRILVALGPIALLASSFALGSEPHPTARTVKLDVRVRVTTPDKHSLALWVPLPRDEAVQKINAASLAIDASGGALAPIDSSRWPAFAHATGHTSELELHWSCVIERHAATPRADLLDLPATALTDKERTDLAPFLLPETGNDLDESFRKTAASLAPGERRLARIARAAFDHVLATLRYDKPPGKGWGQGSLPWVCREGYGNCTDFHALFMNLCRARGIPARFTMGVSLPGTSSGTVEGYHCWCEVYLPGAGWIPVDASEAWKHPERKDQLFGGLDADRVALVEGRDLVLEPRQQGGPVGLLATGYAEADGAPVAVERKITFEELGR